LKGEGHSCVRGLGRDTHTHTHLPSHLGSEAGERSAVACENAKGNPMRGYQAEDDYGRIVAASEIWQKRPIHMAKETYSYDDYGRIVAAS